MTSICLVVVAVMKSVVKCPSYLGNDELHPQDLNALDRAVTSAGEAIGSSDECEDDEVMKILCMLFLQRMRIKIRTW